MAAQLKIAEKEMKMYRVETVYNADGNTYEISMRISPECFMESYGYDRSKAQIAAMLFEEEKTKTDYSAALAVTIMKVIDDIAKENKLSEQTTQMVINLHYIPVTGYEGAGVSYGESEILYSSTVEEILSSLQERIEKG